MQWDHLATKDDLKVLEHGPRRFPELKAHVDGSLAKVRAEIDS